MTGPTMFRLGHLSDVHLGAVPGLRLRDLISKRMVGYYNWRRNRKHDSPAAKDAKALRETAHDRANHVPPRPSLRRASRRCAGAQAARPDLQADGRLLQLAAE